MLYIYFNKFSEVILINTIFKYNTIIFLILLKKFF